MNKKLTIYLETDNNQSLKKEHIPYEENNHILTFSFDNMIHSIDLEHPKFTRENDEYLFLLDIENKKSELSLKKENYLLQLEVEYATITWNKNLIEISYLIEANDSPNKLVIEIEEES